MRNKYFLLFISLYFGKATFSQDVTYLLNEGAQLEKSMKDADALKKYQEAIRLDPANVAALVKCSEMSSAIGNRQKEKNKKQEYFDGARSYAETALKVDPKNADANYVMALSMARLSQLSNGKERARRVRDAKQYADSALAINPNHSRAMHILGRWHFDVAILSFTDKAALKVLYGGLPSASLDDAIECYEKVRKADPWFVLNYLDLAKAYVDNHKTDKAIEVLNRMIKLPPKTQDDAGYKAEGKKLLESLL